MKKTISILFVLLNLTCFRSSFVTYNQIIDTKIENNAIFYTKDNDTTYLYAAFGISSVFNDVDYKLRIKSNKGIKNGYIKFYTIMSDSIRNKNIRRNEYGFFVVVLGDKNEIADKYWYKDDKNEIEYKTKEEISIIFNNIGKLKD